MSSIVRQPVFYPVSVVFLDDSADFLHALRGLFPNLPTHHFFTSQQEARAFIEQRGARGAAHSPMSGEAWSEFEKKGGNALGHDALADASRFEEVAAIVVDYDMPGQDGLEFLDSVKDVNCTRILLTGTADESHAVDAFNAGLIHFYLKKSDPGMTRKLAHALANAQQKHCAGRGHIGVHGVGAIYADRRTNDALHALAQRERLVEYYWRPEQNAVLTFDASGNPGVFLAWDAHDWDAQCDVVTDEGGPSALREEMEGRRIMPVFWPNEAYRPGMARVEFAEPQPLPGSPDAHYSWTRIEGVELAQECVTFAQWMRSRREA
ncbi:MULTISPECIES: response regulator [Paraburkholderia]|jgi:CheY-like chemotaxis protein|uniref:Response regulator receiver domain-containing protein n=1 Tax=Paraburkholderia tropica TaxID=92647 RepID=A0A1A5X4T4_9BURK|nr:MULTISPECIES: response regulator [Paraburkholderia]RQM46908.1 DNA-binding response regulator [Paraburkholderia bannensis]MBB2980857.1 CheY-like chemotaxis protein [Paraburkholderia tropica]MBB3002343.1 CheY-like chemotaxis protein [Paraburkholderia tropica]MBB6321731.1 CheY-like chemotaxis protein [Paraburkholderia tropica]MBN3812741.1 response regulator transcription factor [Paraburkholderia sp. Ac-20347]